MSDVQLATVRGKPASERGGACFVCDEDGMVGMLRWSLR